MYECMSVSMYESMHVCMHAVPPLPRGLPFLQLKGENIFGKDSYFKSKTFKLMFGVLLKFYLSSNQALVKVLFGKELTHIQILLK